MGSYEFKRVGISRFDARDPYRLAVTLTWPGYLSALFALYLSANTVLNLMAIGALDPDAGTEEKRGG